MQAISTNKAPLALGAYSQAMKVNGFIFASGQLGLDPISGEFIGNDTKSQAKQALTNLQEILIEANSDMSKVVKVSIFLKNMDDFRDVNEVYSSFFSEPYPARACVEVAKLPKDAKVEIELVAIEK